MEVLDSLVVSCSSKSFNEQFLGELAWYPISISAIKISSIKYIFAYQKSPIAKITHIAEVESISQFENGGKYIVKFKANPEKIRPIPMGSDQRNVPQNPRYANSKKVKSALNMDYIFS